MGYFKHPALGNRHAPESEAVVLEAQGWTRFPRDKQAKALGSWPPAAPPSQSVVSVSPPSVDTVEDGGAPTVESLRAELSAKGIKFDKRWGLAKLREALGT